MSGSPGDWAALQAACAAALMDAAGRPALAVGVTPRVAVAVDRGVTLWRYGPKPARGSPPPLLIAYSLVNRPYLLDLSADRSLIGALVAARRTVYLADWGTPAAADRHRSLADYVLVHLERAVRAALKDGAQPRLDLAGVCQGGTLALCYAALNAATVRRVVTLVTPVDFATPEDVLGAYARALDVERLVALHGNVPGALLRAGFQSLKLYGNSLGKLLSLVEAGSDPVRVDRLLRTERWIADSPDHAGRAFVEFVQFFYRDNRLVNGGLTLGDRAVTLSGLTQPVLNVYATRDHLVPPAAARALKDLCRSTRYEEHAFDGGHIGVFLSERAQAEVPAAIVRFLAARD